MPRHQHEREAALAVALADLDAINEENRQVLIGLNYAVLRLEVALAQYAAKRETRRR
jgi:hypothetical protein